jgi:hypothetical protein
MIGLFARLFSEAWITVMAPATDDKTLEALLDRIAERERPTGG